MDRLEKWDENKRMEFGINKCNVMQLANKQMQRDRIKFTQFGNNTWEKDLGATADYKHNESQTVLGSIQ